MKTIVTTLCAALAALLLTPQIALAEVNSLRGESELTADSNEPARLRPMTERGGWKRTFKEQPPLIPHKIDKEQIDLKTNTCMKCHSEATYKQKKAPRVGDSHYVDREGKKLDKLSSRRYFCSQCHVLQLDAKPLVDNEFQSVKR